MLWVADNMFDPTGKSTFLRQNALIVILAQAGSFVPAQSATIGKYYKHHIASYVCFLIDFNQIYKYLNLSVLFIVVFTKRNEKRYCVCKNNLITEFEITARKGKTSNISNHARLTGWFCGRNAYLNSDIVLVYCLGIVDRVFARIGASDNLVQHQSTFMSEMLETAFILAQATDKSLVVVDEVGKNSAWFVKGLTVRCFTSHSWVLYKKIKCCILRVWMKSLGPLLFLKRSFLELLS